MLRLVTYNVHSCRGIDGRCLPERIAEVIAEIDPDIALLQELDVERPRTGAVDQVAAIAQILAMERHFQSTIQEASGHYGDAILSKTPLTIRRAGLLPAVPFAIPREARSAIWVEATVAGRPWQIVNTHFGLGRDERRRQARALLADWITPALSQAPLVLCGDFNSRPGSRVHHLLGEPLREVFRQRREAPPPTFSTRWPFTCLDYVYVSPDVQILRAERWTSRLARIASDHFPLVVELA